MATDEERLVVALEARIRDFEKAMDKAEKTATRSFGEMRASSRRATADLENDMLRSTGRINQALSTTSTKIGDFSRSAASMLRAGPLAGLATAGGIVAYLGKMKDELIEVDKLAKRAGLTLREVSGLRTLGAQQGVNAAAIGSGIEGLADKLAEAGREESEFGKLLELNNAKLRDRSGRLIDSNQALEIAARLIQNAANESDKIKIAELMGLSRDWVKILEGGPEALRRMREEAETAGGWITREMVDKAKLFDSEWNKAFVSFNGFAKSQIVDVGRELLRLIRLAQTMPVIGSPPGTVLRDRDLRPGETAGQPSGTLRDASTDEYVARLTRENAVRGGAPLTGGVTRLPSTSGGGGGGGAGDTDTAKKRLDSYIDSLARQDAVLQAQIVTFGQSEAAQKAAMEIARAQVDLNRLDAATRAEVTRRLTEQVHSSEALRVRLEALQKAQRQAVELNEFTRDSFKGLLTDTVSGIGQGKNVWQAFGEAGVRQLDRISQKLIQMATDQLWLSAFGGNGGLFGGGGLLGGLFGSGGGSTMTAILANGGVLNGGNLVPFANGGAFTNSIVTRPTVFPMANGTGLMGEAGPEAVMPLKRDGKGRLGVTVSGGGGGGNVTSIRMGDTNITISGSADKDTVAALRAELDARDRKLKQEIPLLVPQAKRDRMIPRSA